MWLEIAKLGAVLGFDPAPLTLRQLVAAVEAKRRDAWDHTAAIRMEIRNAAFGSRGRTKFEDVHPFKAKTRRTSRVLDKATGGKLLDNVFGVARRQKVNEAK